MRSSLRRTSFKASLMSLMLGGVLTACKDDTSPAVPETASRVEKSVALGQALNVNSTPTLFINGRQVPGVPYEVLQKLVDFAAKDGARAAK